MDSKKSLLKFIRDLRTKRGDEMKTKFRYIHFVKDVDRRIIKTNKSSMDIGSIIWYDPWNRYVMRGKEGYVFSILYLEDIIEFIKQVKERK